jgi:hypothetical protein
MAAPLSGRFPPPFSRALHSMGERRSPEIGRSPEALTIKAIAPVTLVRSSGFKEGKHRKVFTKALKILIMAKKEADKT